MYTVGSIWNRELYTGMRDEIKRYVRYEKQEGEYVPLGDNAIVVRKPDEDFKLEVFPCVSLYIYNQIPNTLRQERSDTILEVHGAKAKAKKPPVKFDVSMYVDFWGKSQSDIDIMTSSWLAGHYRQFNLSLLDSEGKQRSVNCLRNGSIKKSDQLSGDKRLYHTIIPYRMWVEIDSNIVYDKPVVAKVHVRVSHERKEDSVE